jgi:hypothetical protein
MRTQIAFLLFAILTTNLNAQTWNGTTPGNIYYDQGNVTIGASTSNAANLHIGKQENYASSTGEILRLSIQPYGHTGGPWQFRARDTSSDAFLDIAYGSTPPSLTFNSTGYVGVGSTGPKFKFHIRGANANSDKMTLGTNTTGNFALTSADGGAYGLFAGVSSTGRAWMQAGRYDFDMAYDFVLQASGGNVLIGKVSQQNAAYKLDVNGPIRANEIVVNTTGADFVFESTYELRNLLEVEKFITQNKHLPEIPSAKEMQENGISVGEMETKLLQKIEELTLYMIELNKQNQNLIIQNEQLQKRVNKLEAK